MKRPELEYIGSHPMKEKYTEELEKYCDELEKSLDKACDVIADLNSCSNFCSLIYGPCHFEKKCCDYGCVSDKENWKEWCLNDEEDK